jgi:hypothetical protein
MQELFKKEMKTERRALEFMYAISCGEVTRQE